MPEDVSSLTADRPADRAALCVQRAALAARVGRDSGAGARVRAIACWRRRRRPSPLLCVGDRADPSVVVALLVAYHVVGFRAHGWIMRRPWAVFVFVPLGWAIILPSLRVHAAFSVLILGAILQGFIFLPFAWAIATLAARGGPRDGAIVLQPARGG